MPSPILDTWQCPWDKQIENMSQVGRNKSRTGLSLKAHDVGATREKIIIAQDLLRE